MKKIIILILSLFLSINHYVLASTSLEIEGEDIEFNEQEDIEFNEQEVIEFKEQEVIESSEVSSGISRSTVIKAAIFVVVAVVGCIAYSYYGAGGPGDVPSDKPPDFPETVETGEPLSNSLMSDVTAVSNIGEIDPFNKGVSFDDGTIVTRKIGNLSEKKYSRRLSRNAKTEKKRKKHRRNPTLFTNSN